MSVVISLMSRRAWQQQVGLHVRAAERRAAALVIFARSFPVGYHSFTRENLAEVLGYLPNLDEAAALTHLEILRELADAFFAVSDSQVYDAHVTADEALGRLESAARDAVRADTEAAGAA